MQNVILIGRMGSDIEERVTPSNTTLLQFPFAVSRKRGKEETTTWYKITLFENEFSKLLPYLKKGTQLIINGEINKLHAYLSKGGEPKVEANIRPFSIKFSPFSRGDNKESHQLGNNSTLEATPTSPESNQEELPF